jgi:hypothetical protein
LLHLPLEPFDEVLVAPAQEERRFGDELCVVFLGDRAHARGVAQPDIVIQTRAPAHRSVFYSQRAGAQPKDLLQNFDSFAHGSAVGVRAKISSVARGTPRDLHARKRFVGQSNIGEAFVIFQTDIVARLVFFNQRGFQEQGIALGARDDIFQIRDLAHETLCLEICRRLKVRADTIFQRRGLPHIENLPLGIFQEIDARLSRQGFQLNFHLPKILSQN